MYVGSTWERDKVGKIVDYDGNKLAQRISLGEGSMVIVELGMANIECVWPAHKKKMPKGFFLYYIGVIPCQFNQGSPDDLLIGNIVEVSEDTANILVDLMQPKGQAHSFSCPN